MKILASSLIALSLFTSLSGCSNINDEPSWQDAKDSPFIQTNYQAIDRLIQQNKKLSTQQPLLLATIVNIDKLESSSTMGRLITEQLSARLSQQGYQVIELKLRNSLYMKESQGELMLTRELKDVATTHNAQAVLVGTYAKGQAFVYINIKLVQPGTNLVLASTDYALPLDTNNKALLGIKPNNN